MLNLTLKIYDSNSVYLFRLFYLYSAILYWQGTVDGAAQFCLKTWSSCYRLVDCLGGEGPKPHRPRYKTNTHINRPCLLTRRYSTNDHVWDVLWSNVRQNWSRRSQVDHPTSFSGRLVFVNYRRRRNWCGAHGRWMTAAAEADGEAIPSCPLERDVLDGWRTRMGDASEIYVASLLPD